jgi:hypothetical protein
MDVRAKPREIAGKTSGRLRVFREINGEKDFHEKANRVK